VATIERPAPSVHAASARTRRTNQLLGWAVTFFTVAVVIHGADHARRGTDSIGRDVFWLGTSAITVEVAVVVLVCQRHRLAPLAAATAGFSLAFGYVVVHFLPARSWFSDSFTSGDGAGALSWAAAFLEVIAALTLGIVGLATLRQRGGLTSATQPHRPQRSLSSALLHPIALIMILGNAVILGISLVQL